MATKRKATAKKMKTLVLSEDEREILNDFLSPELCSWIEGGEPCATGVIKICVNKLKSKLNSVATKITQKNDGPEDIAKLSAFVSLFNIIASHDEFIGLACLGSPMSVFLALVISLELNATLKSNIFKLITKYVAANPHDNLDQGLTLLNYLMKTVLSVDAKKVTQADMKRLYGLKPLILISDLLNPAFASVKDAALVAFSSNVFLKSNEGQSILGAFLSLERSLIRPIQKIIRDNLLTAISPKLASSYGAVYFHAWSIANPSVRKEIELQCIQDLMCPAFSLARTKNHMEMGELGKKVFAILSHLHALRDKNQEFSIRITELYKPLIWRFLKSAEAIERCNAAQIFLNVFPLEIVASKAERNEFTVKQLKEIKDLLVDDCHIVRILAVRDVPGVLNNSIGLLSFRDVSDIMSVLADQLANDATSYDVREAVFVAFRSLVLLPNTTQLMVPIVTKMYLHMHDVNKKVRLAFFKVLLAIKEKNSAKIFDVVPLNHVVGRILEEDCSLVQQTIAVLVFGEIYTEELDRQPTTIFNNVVRFMKVNPEAVSKLFAHCKGILKSTQSAFTIILSLLGVLRKQLKAVQERNESMAEAQDHEKSQTSYSASDTSSIFSVSENILNNKQFVATIFNCCALLWVTYQDEFFTREEFHSTLMNLAVDAVVKFSREYKNTRAYYAVVSFASLIPSQALLPVTTLPGACLSQLKQMSPEADAEEVECLIVSLTAWNRGNELMELAMEWLDHAFREVNLNQSAIPSRKVRFQRSSGKPLLAVKYMTYLFEKAVAAKKILKNRYDEAYDFLMYLNRVKQVIKRRLENGGELGGELSDTLIIKCYELYLSVMTLLHRPDDPPKELANREPLQPLNSATFSSCLIEWAFETIVPHLPQNRIDLSVRLIKMLISNAAFLIDINYSHENHSSLVTKLLRTVLEKDCSLYFVEDALDTIRALAEYSSARFKNDDWNIMESAVPQLLGTCLNILSESDLTSEVLNKCTKDVLKFKKSLFAVLDGTKAIGSTNNDTFRHIFNKYVSTLVSNVARDISKVGVVETYSKVDDHSTFVSLILRHLLTKARYRPILFSALNEHINSEQNGINLLACVSLLTTMTYSCQHSVDRKALEICVVSAFKSIKAYDATKQQNSSCDSFYDESPINVLSTGEPLIRALGSTLGCSLE